MLSLDVLKREKYDASNEKHLFLLHSQRRNKSEENYCNDNTEKNSSNKRQVTKIEFRSPISVENHCNNKLGKDSKKSFVEKLWEPIFHDTEEEHSVESIKHEEFCSSDKEANNSGIMLAENKLKLRFGEINSKQHNSNKEQKFKEDQTVQNQTIFIIRYVEREKL